MTSSNGRFSCLAMPECGLPASQLKGGVRVKALWRPLGLPEQQALISPGTEAGGVFSGDSSESDALAQIGPALRIIDKDRSEFARAVEARNRRARDVQDLPIRITTRTAKGVVQSGP